jgi:aminoglycoside 2'-N-acetyltransferase I
VHVLAAAGSETVGHASVVVRRLLTDGGALRTGYVEAVATAALHRRRGIASAVMAEVERLVAGGFELGALATSDQGAALYTVRGWTPWTGPTAGLTLDGVVEETDAGVFVLPTSLTPAGLDPAGRLVCDWRPGDLW